MHMVGWAAWSIVIQHDRSGRDSRASDDVDQKADSRQPETAIRVPKRESPLSG
jgi:hypothetical protein